MVSLYNQSLVHIIYIYIYNLSYLVTLELCNFSLSFFTKSVPRRSNQYASVMLDDDSSSFAAPSIAILLPSPLLSP